MNINGLLVTNLLLLLVNLLTVIGNIFLPRYLENPDIEIVSVSTFVDESEVALPKSIARTIAAVIEIRSDGDEYFSMQGCFNALNDHYFIPEACREPFIKTVNSIIENSKLQKKAKLDVLKDIDDFDEKELVAALQLSTPLGYISTFYNDVFFNLLTAEHIAKEEIAEPMRDSLIDVAIGLVQKEFSYIESLENSIRILEEHDQKKHPPPRIVLQIVLLNSGHSPDLIDPKATLNLGTRKVKLTMIDSKDIPNPNKGKSSKHIAVPAGSAETIYFEIDRDHNTVSDNEFIEEFLGRRTSLDYRITLNGSEGPIRKEGGLEPEEISFEMSF